mgnify:FL=1
MKKIRLSVIIPIYCVEKYIGVLLASLTPNLLPGIEVIFVDDGSKDNCGSIIDAYQQQHLSYVKLIHKQNGGVSSARNAALAIASGEYVSFVDGDDYIPSDYFTSIVSTLAKYGDPDLLIFDFYSVVGDNVTAENCREFNEGFVDRIFFARKNLDVTTTAIASGWNKVVKRTSITGIYFDEKIKYGEDSLFFIDILSRLKKIVYLQKPLYYYRMNREGSLCVTKKLKEEIILFEEIKRRFERYKDDYQIEAIGRTARIGYDILKELYINDRNSNQIEYYENFLKKNLISIIFNDNLNTSLKKHCLYVCLGIAPIYNRIKYKR